MKITREQRSFASQRSREHATRMRITHQVAESKITDPSLRWENLLYPQDRRDILEIRQMMFKKWLGYGFTVVEEISQESGRLVVSGDMHLTNFVASYVAQEEIRHRELQDRMEGRQREYIWENLALTPPENWKDRKSLSKHEITIDPAGITILARDKAR